MARVARRGGPKTAGNGLFWEIAHYSWTHDAMARFRGGVTAAMGVGLVVALASYNAADPSLNASSSAPAANLLGAFGAVLADIAIQSVGLAAWAAAILMVAIGLTRAAEREP